jgi:hypothetical protein
LQSRSSAVALAQARRYRACAALLTVAANLDPATDGQACVGHVPSTSNEQVGIHKHSSERRQHHSIEEEEEGGVSADKEKEEGGTVASGKYEDKVVGYLWNFLQGSHSTDSGFMCKGCGRRKRGEQSSKGIELFGVVH